MKEFIFIIILINLTLSLTESIKSISSNDSFNEIIYSPYNPVNGTDYWKSKSICCGQHADWVVELNAFMYIICQ
jgi:hypothetical protein